MPLVALRFAVVAEIPWPPAHGQELGPDKTCCVSGEKRLV
jgi:hypothetical protein